MESVTEGVYVSGTVSGAADGRVRSVPARRSTTRSTSTSRSCTPTRDSTTDETTDEDEVGRMQGDLIDLEPVVRDAVVLALPVNPLCREDCPGLCPECGVPWDDLPADHSHDAGRPAVGRIEQAWLETPARATTVGEHRRTSHRDREGVRSRGRPQAQDVAQQHPVPPGELEGDGGRDRRLPAVQVAEAAARRRARSAAPTTAARSSRSDGDRHVETSPGRIARPARSSV